jgi:hypothetical protein
MKIKELIKSLIPPLVLIIKNKTFPAKVVVSTASKPLESGFEELCKNNEKFRNKHFGERVFILASGPSIKTQNLKPLENETCIAVSHFHLHEDIHTINPRYHVLAPQHPPFNFNDSSKYFRDFIKAYPDNQTSIFLGINHYKYNYLQLLKEHPELKRPIFYYLDYSAGMQLDEQNHLLDDSWDITKSPFAMRTVIYGAIQLAIFMGFKQIILLGCDHDYLNDINRTTNHHFYQEEKGISDKSHLEQFTREKWFFEYYMRWKDYRLMNEYAASKGVKIINATNGGLLDVFERRELTQLI